MNQQLVVFILPSFLKGSSMSDKVTILLVEDNRMDIELAVDAFENSSIPCTVTIAETGEKALSYLMGKGSYRNREKHPIPDLVLLDLKLPGISGPEVLKEMKATKGLRRLPVVILTSSSEQDDVIKCYENGANSYLIKPVTYAGFEKIVEQINEYWFDLNISAPKMDENAP
ncbi:MAG: response regulator [Proteobacteria bacterium]|nr:response regulator [Pseudomonadota bacterium]